MRAWLRRREAGFLVVALVSIAIGIVAYETEAFEGLELDSVDTRFSIRGHEDPAPDIVFVKVDDVTLDDLNTRWPFPRSFHADLIDRLREAKARTIAFDIQFTEPTRPKQDNALITAVDRADNVVLATTEVDDKGGSKVFGGEEVLRAIGARSANTGLNPDTGGVLRRGAYELDGLKTFPIVVAEVNAGKPIKRSELPDKDFWIDFAGPPDTVPSYSYSHVLNGRVPASELRGKTVIVGASAPRLQDLHETPFSRGEPMPGPEVLANATATVENGFPMSDAPGVANILAIVLLGLVAPAASIRFPPMIALGLAVAAGALFLLWAQLAFSSGDVVVVVYPLIALAISAIGSLALHYVLAALERAQVRSTFSRFVPESVVEDVMARTGEDLRLGGVRRLGTVMFSDLRGFTSFAEGLEPNQVIDVLNRYLSGMSDAIMDEGGTLVAYMGDGIMAVFGAPLEQDDHADRALRAARTMTGERLEQFNRGLREDGLSENGFRMGIGLNTGWVMSGNVGSDRRMEYTAVGDTTNTAARLEGMTKGTAYQIFLADSTRDALAEQPTDVEFVDEFEVRGREARLKVWGVPDTS